ncbi:MAG TPA: hypothetical protein VJN18_17435 [Polyangiaceae bacterium]|nr:hypothetical protein [Polyangiaceae bacterium]
MPQDVVTTSDFPKSWSFEPTGRLVHLRWAVAELAITIETPSAALDAAERALRIFGQRATTLIQNLETDSELLADTCYTAQLGIAEAQTSLRSSGPLRVDRARALHAARRKLHRALVIVAEAMARQGGARCAAVSGFDAPELGSLLALRQMFSAFRGGMISAGEQRARLSWALEVASAELSVLIANPVLSDLPLGSQQLIHDLARRVTAWGLRQPDPVLGRSLYREAATIPSIAAELSAHPLLIEHDEQALSELAAVLAHEPSGPLLDSRVLGQLCSLRGLDSELDQLELTLIYGAAGALGTLSIRVADLRSRFSRPTGAAASWS